MSEIVYGVVRILWLILIVAVIAGIAIFLIVRQFLKRSVSMDASSYPQVKRQDVSGFLPIRDIRDGIVCMEKRYVAAIEVQGCDLYHASAEEQETVMENYTRFVDMLPDTCLQARYDPVVRDLNSYIENYRSQYEQVCEQIYDRLETIDRLTRMLGRPDLSAKDSLTLSERVVALQKETESLTSRKQELNELVRWLRYNSDEDYCPDMQATYVISHETDAVESAMEEELTKEQKFLRAKQELTGLANSYIHAFADAHLHAKMITQTEEMTDLFRRYFRPVSGKTGDVSKILHPERIATDSERDMQQVGRIGDDAYTMTRLAEAHQRIVRKRKERQWKEVP